MNAPKARLVNLRSTSPPMDISKWFARETWQLDTAEWVVVTATSVAIALALTTAWTTGGASLVLVLVPAVLLVVTGYGLSAVKPVPVLIGLVIAWFYALVSLLWAADLGSSLSALALSATLIGGLHLSLSVYTTMPVRWLEHMTRTVLVCFAVILVYGLIEETFDHQIKRALFWPFQAIRFADGGVTVNWDHVSRVRAFRTNWNMTTTSLLLWPVLLIAQSHLDRKDYRWLAPLIIAAVIAMVAQSEHVTAVIAIVFATVVYVATGISFRAVAVLAAVAWLGAIVSVMPVSQLAFERQVHLHPSLSGSIRQRVVLWKYTADRIAERPLLGVGVGSTAPLDEARGYKLPFIPGTNFQMRTGHHPHNIFLQVWYEFGLIGAILLLGLGWQVIWWMQRLSGPERSAYMAAFVTGAVTSAAGFGLFEIWYVSALALGASVLWMTSHYREALRTRTDAQVLSFPDARARPSS